MAAAIFPPFLIATFDWRYELPQLSLIPVAAVLGVLAMTGGPPEQPAEPAKLDTEVGLDQGEMAL